MCPKFNIALIPVISFFYIYIKKGKEQVFQIDKIVVKQDSLFLLGSISILSLACLTGANFYLASLLILFYLLYIFYIIKKRSKNKEQDLNKNITLGGALTVRAECEILFRKFDFDEIFIKFVFCITVNHHT